MKFTVHFLDRISKEYCIEDKKLNETQKDTVYLYSELGETIEGQTISISTEQLINLTIEQRYETSVTIMGEGPHCDLIDWKHYDSEWKTLKLIKLDNLFVIHIQKRIGRSFRKFKFPN